MNFKRNIFLLFIALFIPGSIFSSAMPPAQQPALPAAQCPPKHPGKSQAKVLKDSTVSYMNINSKAKKQKDENKDIKQREEASKFKPPMLNIDNSAFIDDLEAADKICEANPQSVLIKNAMLFEIKMRKLKDASRAKLTKEEEEAIENLEVEDIFCEARDAYIQFKVSDSNSAAYLWKKLRDHDKDLRNFICNSFDLLIEKLMRDTESLTWEKTNSIPLKRFFGNDQKGKKKHPWENIIDHIKLLAAFKGTNLKICIKEVVLPFLKTGFINKENENKIDIIFNNLNTVIKRLEEDLNTPAQLSIQLINIFIEITDKYDTLNKMLNNVDPIYNEKRAEYRQLIQKIRKENAQAGVVAAN